MCIRDRDWCEIVSWDHSKSLGISPQTYQDLRCACVVIKNKIDYLGSLFENDRMNWKEGTLASGLDEKRKKCTELFVEKNQKNPYNDLFLNEMNIVLEEYKKEYPFLDKLPYWGFDKWYKIQRYYYWNID